MARKLERTETASPPLVSSLAELLRSRGVSVADGAPEASREEPPAASPAVEVPAGARIVLRRERKGHGGKTVTLVEGLGLAADRLEALARQLRRSLGSGARVDAGRIVVQGDRIGAVEAWLRARGAARITRAN